MPRHLCQNATLPPVKREKAPAPKDYELIETQVFEGDVTSTVIESKPATLGKYSEFDYRSFSIQNLIDTNNVDLLNPVGIVRDSKLNATDNVNRILDSIESINNANLE